ncbi:hypothetical protein [Xanthovirga aplysinae]|uniref:hypothetical protein n=1 Tax=Xanthovirga aplysinae TaxID=2529853 RepID=UPI0012BC3878|nr:hypothetical protein [Xanthovirga aplysinae]MTI31613.1 hypothetical protein [Xanthovirga aplysinae]
MDKLIRTSLFLVLILVTSGYAFSQETSQKNEKINAINQLKELGVLNKLNDPKMKTWLVDSESWEAMTEHQKCAVVHSINAFTEENGGEFTTLYAFPGKKIVAQKNKSAEKLNVFLYPNFDPLKKFSQHNLTTASAKGYVGR